MLRDRNRVLVACALGALCAASATMVLVLGTRLAFFNDEWFVLLQRPGLSMDSVLAPHNEHPVVLPVLIYKANAALFGLELQLPYRLVLTITLLMLALAVFLFVRERVGELLALLAAAVLLFLGPAWEDLLWSFQLGQVGSLAAGVAVLCLLSVDTFRRNAIACALLVLSLLLSDLAIPFIAGAAVTVLLRRRPQELWVPGVPAVLFAVWWVIYGSDAESHVTLSNIAHLPAYASESLATAIASIFGVASVTGLTQYSREPIGDGWARVTLGLLAALGLLLIVVWLFRRGRVSEGAIVIASVLLCFWIVAGASEIPGRAPSASRYQLVSATLLILLAAELFRSSQPSPRALAAISVLTFLAIALNLVALREGYDFLHKDRDFARAALGALEIAHSQVRADFQLSEPLTHVNSLNGVTAERYFAETDAHGSPADSPAEIASEPPPARQAGDNVLAAAYGLAVSGAPGHAPKGDGCRNLALAGADDEIDLPRGGVRIVNRGPGPVELGVRRFAPMGLPVRLGSLQPRFATALQVPADRVSRPWRLVATGEGSLAVCPLVESK